MHLLPEIKKLNIRQRVILFCVALGSGVTLLTWSLLANMGEIKRLSNDVEARWLPRERLLGQVRALVANYRFRETERLVARTRADKASASVSLDSLRNEIGAQLEAYASFLKDSDAELLKQAREIQGLWKFYAAEAHPLSPTARGVFPVLREKLAKLDELEQSKTVEAIHADDQLYDRSYVLLVLSSGVFLLIILVLYLYIDRKVLNPLVKLGKDLNVLSSGNFGVSLLGGERHDEIGLVTRSADEFRALAASLDRSEKLMTRLLESSFDGILIFRNGKVLDSNAVLRRRFLPEVESDEVRDWIQFPEKIDLLALEKALRDGETNKQVFRDVPQAPRNGTSPLLDLALSRIDWGGETACLLVAHDVSDRASLASAIAGAATAEFQRLLAEEANVAKSLFISSISHELRNPLNTIIGFSQVMEAETKSANPGWARYAGNIRKSGQHLLALIEDLLDLSVLEAGKLSLVMKAHPAEDFIRETLSAWRPVAEEAGLEFKVSLQLSPGLRLSTDRTRMRQVLANLLSNAIKYNRKDGTIHVKVEESPASVRIEIEDTGRGIPPQKAKHVFEPFNRLGAEKGEIKGMGIGLALSKKLCNNMGASLDFDSQAEKGTRFWVIIPLTRTEAVATRTQEVALVGPREASVENRKTVLYVEDNETNYEVIAAMLKNLPVELLWVTTAEEGLDIVQSKKPALIFMDINLPGMDGFSALRQLRSSVETSHIPVVAVSANADDEAISRAKREGFRDYIIKPVDIRKVIEVVHSLG